MGATSPALSQVRAAALLSAALAMLAAARPAAAGCLGTRPSGERFPTCFDVGNQLFLTASTDGFGGGLRLRHVIRFEDEPDLVWKLDHRLLTMRAGGLEGRLRGALYRGRFLRHARDGHLVLPFGIPRKIFLPFDIGAEVSLGEVSGSLGADLTELGVIRTAALIDLARTPSLRRRLVLGAVASWSMAIDRSERDITGHRVVPFSQGLLGGYLESSSGLTVAAARLQMGSAWSSDADADPDGGFGFDLSAHARLERTLFAINDRPLSLFAAGSYQHRHGELIGQLGVRVALFQHRDPRAIPVLADSAR